MDITSWESYDITYLFKHTRATEEQWSKTHFFPKFQNYQVVFLMQILHVSTSLFRKGNKLWRWINSESLGGISLQIQNMQVKKAQVCSLPSYTVVQTSVIYRLISSDKLFLSTIPLQLTLTGQLLHTLWGAARWHVPLLKRLTWLNVSLLCKTKMLKRVTCNSTVGVNGKILQ